MFSLVMGSSPKSEKINIFGSFQRGPQVQPSPILDILYLEHIHEALRHQQAEFGLVSMFSLVMGSSPKITKKIHIEFF